MLHALFWGTGAIVWILVIVALIILIRNNNGSLYKSETNRVICGVCGGLGEYFNIDPTIIRLIWVVITICGGSGILVYLLAALVMSRGKRA